MPSGNERTPSPILVAMVTVVVWAFLVGALPLGIALIHWGLDGLNRDQPYCYGVAMSRGGTCQIDEYRVHRENDYDGQLAYEHHGAKVQIGFGVLLSLIGALFLSFFVVSRSKIWPKRKLD